MTQLALALTMGAVQKPASLALRALAAVKRAGGTVLAAGAATPVLGPELVTNGMFDTDSAWGKGEGWSISGGSAVRVPFTLGSVLSQGVTLVAGKKYLVTYSVSITAQGIYVSLAGGTSVDGASRTTSGTYSQELTALPGNNAVWLVTGSAASNLSVDNISVKEILGYTYGNLPLRNYFDSAGTDILDSVTQVDQPVGLVLDGAGTVGPELLSPVWSSPSTGVTQSGSNLIFTAAPAGLTSQGNKTVANKSYALSITVDSISGGTLKLIVSGGAGTVSITSPGTYTAVAKASDIDGPYISVTSGTVTAVVSASSCKEITGNHATQATTGSKPTLRRGLVNQLLWSGDFTNAAWVKQFLTIGSATTDPFGGLSAVTVAVGSAGSLRQNSIAWTAGTTGSLAYWVRKSASGGANFVRLTTNNTAAWGTGISQKFALTSEWQLVVLTGVLTSTGTLLSVVFGALDTGAAGDTDCVGNVDIYRAALYQGTVTAQQILAAGGIPLTTTAPASSALGNYWWQFDPAAPGDFLQTSITTGNEGWVCAGVTPTQVTTAMTVFNSGATSDTVKGVWLYANAGSWVLRVGNGTARTDPGALTASAGVPVVVSGGWTESTVTLDKDWVSVSAARSGDCTSPSAVLIGAISGGALALNGGMSVQVICPTLPPPADRALIRKWVGSLQGQTL